MGKDFTPPKKSKGDLAHAAAKGALGAIPFAGAAATELFNLIVTPPIQKRRDDWMADVGEAISELAKNKGLTQKDLSENDAFIDIIMEASQAAVRTSQKEKREALKNAVLNTAVEESPDESLNNMFIRFVDDFTIWHLKAIQIVYAPDLVKEQTGKDIYELRNYKPVDLILYIYPDLEKDKEFIEQVLKNLNSRGLIIAKFGPESYHGTDKLKSHRTELGQKFYKFITYSEDR